MWVNATRAAAAPEPCQMNNQALITRDTSSTLHCTTLHYTTIHYSGVCVCWKLEAWNLETWKKPFTISVQVFVARNPKNRVHSESHWIWSHIITTLVWCPYYKTKRGCWQSTHPAINVKPFTTWFTVLSLSLSLCALFLWKCQSLALCWLCSISWWCPTVEVFKYKMEW